MRSLTHANSTIKSAPQKSRTIYLSPGTFSEALTGEKYPINLLENVCITGSGIDSTISYGNADTMIFNGAKSHDHQEFDTVKISDCTIVNNKNIGIAAYDGSWMTLLNSIIYYNNLCQILLFDCNLKASYIDIQDEAGIHTGGLSGGFYYFGDGILSLDPEFVDAANNDYHLNPDSPCRDAGNPDASFNDADSTHNDLGAFGGPAGILF